MDSSSIKSIAVFRLSALGDVCMILPLIYNLKKNFPHAKIYWIISEGLLPFVDGISGVEFIPIKKPRRLLDFFRCYRLLKGYTFDVLLAAQASFSSNLLIACVKAKVKFGYGSLHQRDGHRLFVNKTVEAKPEHTVDGFLQFLKPLGIDSPELVWDLPVDAKALSWAKGVCQDQHCLVVCPVSSKDERNWLLQRYIDLLQQIEKTWNIKIILVGDRRDISLNYSKEISSQLNNCLDLTGKTNLKELTALLASSDILISPDTGTAHIASAVGTTVIGLYAVGRVSKSGPYLSQNTSINKFPQAAKKFLNKSEEQVSWRTRVHHQDAMSLITVDEVLAMCLRVFKNKGIEPLVHT